MTLSRYVLLVPPWAYRRTTETGTERLNVKQDSGGPPAFGPLRWPLRPLTMLLVVGLSAGSVSLAAVSRNVVHDQERRLLDQRAAEVSALLSLSTSRVQEAFRSLTTVVQVAGPDSVAFNGTAAQAVAARVFGAVAVVQADGSGCGGPRPGLAHRNLHLHSGLPGG
jgi:hypothetical protein